jgi:hypothetical protein
VNDALFWKKDALFWEENDAFFWGASNCYTHSIRELLKILASLSRLYECTYYNLRLGLYFAQGVSSALYNGNDNDKVLELYVR